MEEWKKIFEEGKELFRKKKYEEARKKFSQVIQLYKDNWDAYGWRGHAFFRLKKYKEAAQDFSTYLNLRKDDYFVLSSRAFAFNMLKKYEEALRDCDNALKLNEKDSWAHHQRGNAYLGLQRYNDTIRDCSKSIELDKYNPYPYYYRGMAYKNVGKCSESIRDLSKAIQLSEHNDFFKDLHLEDAKVALDEEVSKLQKKRVTFVQQFFACQETVVIERSSNKDGYEVFLLEKKGLFGGQKRSKVFEGSFKNGKFHGEGVVFDQETGKEMYEGIWEEGRLSFCKSGRRELKTLPLVVAMNNDEIASLRKEVAKLKEVQDCDKTDLVEEVERLKTELKEREKKQLDEIRKLKEDGKGNLLLQMTNLQEDHRKKIAKFKEELIQKGEKMESLRKMASKEKNELETKNSELKKEVSKRIQENATMEEARLRERKESKLLLQVKTEENTRLNEGIKEKDLRLKEGESIIIKKDQELLKKDLQIEKKNDVIKKKDRKLLKKDEIIKKRDLALQEKGLELQRFHTSQKSSVGMSNQKLKSHEIVLPRQLTTVGILGSGSFAVVCKVKIRFEGKDKIAAFKMMKPDLVSLGKIVDDDVLKEARKLLMLDHVNVLKCYGYSLKYHKGIFTELCEASLENKLINSLRKGGKKISLGLKIDFLKQIAAGLSYLHEKNLVHRDLKLDNVLIVKNVCKIIDFGTSRKIEGLKGTIMSSIKGTPFYVAPQVIDQTTKYNDLCDVFSFGVCCFSLFYEVVGMKKLEKIFYKGLSVANDKQKITKLLQDRNWEPKYPVLSNPSNREKKLIGLIKSCLKVFPYYRPSFKNICKILDDIIATKDGSRQ